MFSNNTFVAAYRLAREYAADLTSRATCMGEEHIFVAARESVRDIQMALEELDREVHLATRDENNLAMWGCLRGACHDRLRIIRMNLRSWGEPEWDWKEVIEAISFIAAVDENTSVMLEERALPSATVAPS